MIIYVFPLTNYLFIFSTEFLFLLPLRRISRNTHGISSLPALVVEKVSLAEGQTVGRHALGLVLGRQLIEARASHT